MSPRSSFPALLPHPTSGLQSAAWHHHLGLWQLHSWRRLGGFILELIWSHRHVPKTTVDTWCLRMILMEFGMSMPPDTTSAVMQLTCHSAQSNHSLVNDLLVVQGETEFFEDCIIPSSSQSNLKRYHPHSSSHSQNSGRDCHSRAVSSDESLGWWCGPSVLSNVVATHYVWPLSIWT